MLSTLNFSIYPNALVQKVIVSFSFYAENIAKTSQLEKKNSETTKSDLHFH